MGYIPITEDELANIRVQSMNDDYFYQSILHYMKDRSEPFVS